MTCDRKIGPFDCCSVVQGDCLELMKQIPDGAVDAVITDPPYGIGADKRNAHSSIRDTDRLADIRWDVRPPQHVIDEIRRVSVAQVIWGGNYFDMPATQCWFIWNKPERNFSLADAELAWTNFASSVRVFDFPRHDGERQHPTQKPLPLMAWCVQRVKADTILDPFCGSGTTLVAAKKLGRHFLGFEISADYCAIARRRLDEIDAQPTLFEAKPEQLSL